MWEFLAAAAFHIVFLFNLDNLKKHRLRLGILELKFFENPHFANTFSVSCKFTKTVIHKEMPDKNEIERRKQIKKELREKARLEFEQSLPISREKFQNLFYFLDEKLSEIECDDTLKLTTEYLQKNGTENIEDVKKWLAKNGGFCDCEVLYNVEEKFEKDAIL